ncbi:MAG TPA: hypothetical protein VD926_15010 [Acidimicrobiales bacterium]|nr:hypothetical protein [Acidimicrobiales bacterium]
MRGDDQPDETAADGLPEDPDTTGAGPFERWRSQLPTLLVVVLAVLVAGAAFVLYQQNQDLQGEKDDRREASEVASDFTTAVLSYDHRDLQGSLDAVLALSTRDWGRQYEDAWYAEQRNIVDQLQARGTIEVVDVMVGDPARGELPVIVRFNADIRSTIGVRTLEGSYLQVDLVDQDGQWLVDDMSYLAIGEENLTPAEGGNGQGGGGETPATTTTP